MIKKICEYKHKTNKNDIKNPRLFYPFHASGDLCRLLTTFTKKSFNPDQDQQNVGPDLDPNRSILLLCS